MGWLLDQRRKGTPSLGLRLQLLHSTDLQAQYEEARGEAYCYDSVNEVVRLNMAADREKHPERYG